MLDIVDQHPQQPLTEELRHLIKRTVQATLTVELVQHDVELSIILVDRTAIRDLNHAYRQRDVATDVLSFVQYEDDGFVVNDDAVLFLGDIVLCYEIAIEQAAEYNHTTEREIAYLVCHGCLHLLGYDHMTDDDKHTMRHKEEQVMQQLELERI